MAKLEKTSQPSVGEDLASRAERYRDTVELIVRKVGEHPLYELKRACHLGTAAQRVELVKDIQSIATSHIETEKYLVIGADASQRCIVPVDNIGELDEAAIRQLLGKYLEPVPDFEAFHLRSSEGHPFVLLVIPRQKTRRIVARVTVDDPSDMKPKLLLRQGDIWTKSAGEVGSTAKRLATGQDLDDIYHDRIEREVEDRTRKRTAHFFEEEIARERARLLSVSDSPSAIPISVSDAEYVAHIEHLLLSQNNNRFNLLLEKLRDELIEYWHKLHAYDRSNPDLFNQPSSVVPQLQAAIREHKENVFLPALQRLILIGLHILKNQGPAEWFTSVVGLIAELYESGETLELLKRATPRGSTGQRIEQHISHTFPALESLISLHILGAYLVRRNRFAYFPILLRVNVLPAGRQSESLTLSPVAFWPILSGWGEPDALRYRAGRVNVCVERSLLDSGLMSAFGSEESLRNALCAYEFCLELNSFLAIKEDITPKTVAYTRQHHSSIDFSFWPSFIAFPFTPLKRLVQKFYLEITTRALPTLTSVLFDKNLAKFFYDSEGKEIFLRFLQSLSRDQAELHRQQNRMPPWWSWPEPIHTDLSALRAQDRAAGTS